jgi:hypothetical protein
MLLLFRKCFIPICSIAYLFNSSTALFPYSNKIPILCQPSLQLSKVTEKHVKQKRTLCIHVLKK